MTDDQTIALLREQLEQLIQAVAVNETNLNMLYQTFTEKFGRDQGARIASSVFLSRQVIDRTQPGIAEAMELVVKYMHPESEHLHDLRIDEIEQIVELADGFGKISYKEFRTMNSGYDWSHFRDSTGAAILAMAAKLKEFVPNP